KRVSAVGIEETTTVRAQLLDDFLRGDRALRYGLFADGCGRRFAISAGFLRLLRFDQLDGVIRMEVLHHALRHEKQRTNHAERKQDPQCSPHHIDPEIPDGLHLTPGYTANECN